MTDDEELMWYRLKYGMTVDYKILLYCQTDFEELEELCKMISKSFNMQTILDELYND